MTHTSINKNGIYYSLKQMKSIAMISLKVGVLSLATSLASANDSFTIPYFETDGSLQEMSTWRIVAEDNSPFVTNQVVGKVQTTVSPEHIAVFRYNNEKSFSLINLDNNQAVYAINNETMNALGEAIKIKLYELNYGVIESAVYSSENGVCKDYNSENGIQVNFATSYYPDFRPNTDSLFATIANFQLYDAEPVRFINAENKIQVNDPDLRQAVDNLIAERSDQVLQDDAIKLNSFINFLCDSQLTLEDDNS